VNTILLAGYSSSNKVWAEDVKKALDPHVPINIHYWNHWENEREENWKVKEVEIIIKTIGTDKVNILAKSIGTLVAMHVIKKIPTQINKLILCGLPLGDLVTGDNKDYELLKNFTKETVMVIQNENDPHGSFESVKKLISSINPGIEIIPKPADNHDYVYSYDFLKFLQ